MSDSAPFTFQDFQQAGIIPADAVQVPPEGPGLMTADSPTVGSSFGPQQWGIFSQDGQPVLVSDAVGGVEYTREYAISDYPQEQGAFESYNKVQIPFQAKVTLLSSLTREQLLSTLESIVYSLNLVAVVTPEVSYPSANLTRYSLRRTARNGVTLIAVDLWCEEVRQDAGSQTSSVSSQDASQTAGTPSPVGKPSSRSNLGAGSSSSGDLAVGGAVENTGFRPPASGINAASTNAAYPTQSGPTQPEITDVGSAMAFAPLSVPF